MAAIGRVSDLGQGLKMRRLSKFLRNRKGKNNEVEKLPDSMLKTYLDSVKKVKIVRDGDVATVCYENDRGFDYETYKRVQVEGNKWKIDRVFVSQENIAYICNYYMRHNSDIRMILCHGTRNGAEQRYFRDVLGSNVEIIGTEISDTASRFPDTIEWDFHEVKSEWLEAADIIYSNSWDHSYDPIMLFSRWASCLSSRGLMFLEHSRFHTADSVNVLDPFGISLPSLIRLINDVGEGNFRVLDVIRGELPDRSNERALVVVGRV